MAVVSLKFLERLPKYEHEKPFFASVAAEVGFQEDIHTNLNLKEIGVPITDIRPKIQTFKLQDCGFEVIPHESTNLDFQTEQDTIAYTKETAAWLKRHFDAEHVVCWDFKIRRNELFTTTSYDVLDSLQFEQPARSVHNDSTFESGPYIVKRYLSEEDRQKYLRPGFRFRLINTWRTILPILEDNPLAVCDFRSLSPSDLIPSDRIRPDKTGEIFHVFHNPEQKWYWLAHMKSNEPLVFVVYDSKAGDQARLCPHASFTNPNASSNAPPRHSVETRSIIITKDL